LKLIIYLGTQIYFLLGKIKEGYMPGATFLEVVRNLNPDPGKCSKDTGVTFLSSDLALIEIEAGGVKISCWGSYTTTFQPGMNYN
jgi:hypothetical protein